MSDVMTSTPMKGAATVALEKAEQALSYAQGRGVRWSPSRGKIGAALAKAHAAVKGAVKDSTNPHYRSKYADLASVAEACREALTANEIAFPQPAWTDHEGLVVVTTILLHSSGEWMEADLAVKPPQPGPQALGSCITYLRRYGLAAVSGVAPEDDDAESAEREPGRPFARPAPARVEPPPPGSTGAARTSSSPPASAESHTDPPSPEFSGAGGPAPGSTVGEASRVETEAGGDLTEEEQMAILLEEAMSAEAVKILGETCAKKYGKDHHLTKSARSRYRRMSKVGS